MWTARELQFDDFLKSGASNANKDSNKLLGASPDKSLLKDLPPSSVYHSTRAGAVIVCNYDHSKTLQKVEVWFERGSKGDVRITIPQGTVTLPTSEENLTRKLGEPSQFRSGHNRWVM